MAQLIVREIEDSVAQALRERAARNGRSAEAEHRILLREALLPGGTGAKGFAAAAAILRSRLAESGDSTGIIRQMRDRKG